MKHEWAKLLKLVDNVQRTRGNVTLLVEHLEALMALSAAPTNQVPLFKSPETRRGGRAGVRIGKD